MGLDDRIDKRIDEALKNDKRKLYQFTQISESTASHFPVKKINTNKAQDAAGNEYDWADSGLPNQTDAAIKASGKLVVPTEESSRFFYDDGGGAAIIILRKTNEIDAAQQDFWVKRIESDTQYSIDTYGISGASLETGINKIVSVLFSYDGLHLLVGAQDYDDDGNIRLNWGYVPNFSLLETPSPHVGTAGLVQGIKIISDLDEVTMPSALPVPAPYTTTLEYDSGCTCEEFRNDDFSGGLKGCIEDLTVQSSINFEAETDPAILDYAQVIEPANVTGGTYVFWLDGEGDPKVDFVGAWRSRKANRTFYRRKSEVSFAQQTILFRYVLDDEITETECVFTASSTFPFTYTPVEHPYTCGGETAPDICVAYDPSGCHFINQSRNFFRDPFGIFESHVTGSTDDFNCTFAQSVSDYPCAPSGPACFLSPTPPGYNYDTFAGASVPNWYCSGTKAVFAGGTPDHLYVMQVSNENVLDGLFAVEDLNGTASLTKQVTRSVNTQNDNDYVTHIDTLDTGDSTCTTTFLLFQPKVTTTVLVEGPTPVPIQGFKSPAGSSAALSNDNYSLTLDVWTRPYTDFDSYHNLSDTVTFSDIIYVETNPIFSGITGMPKPIASTTWTMPIESGLDIEIRQISYNTMTVVFSQSDSRSGSTDPTKTVVDWAYT